MCPSDSDAGQKSPTGDGWAGVKLSYAGNGPQSLSAVTRPDEIIVLWEKWSKDHSSLNGTYMAFTWHLLPMSTCLQNV